MTDEMDPEVYAARVWHFSERIICGELDHGCGLAPPLPCVPCLLDQHHDGDHDGRSRTAMDPGNDAILAAFRALATTPSGVSVDEEARP